MKHFAIATALLGASALQSSESLELQVDEAISAQSQQEFKAELKIQGLITDALKNGGKPYEITVPKVNPKVDKEGNEKLGVKSNAPNYRFDWKYVCAFTKWTPSNQFLNAKRKYVASEMTLARFGFVGTDKSCFWGMTGVHWLTPLKVDQIIPPKGTAPPKTKAKKPVVKPTLKFLGERKVELSDDTMMAIGLSTREINGQTILEVLQPGASFESF